MFIGRPGRSRASALAGSLAAAKDYHAQTAAAGAAIAGEEDRQIFTGDFQSGDWFGLDR